MANLPDIIAAHCPQLEELELVNYNHSDIEIGKVLDSCRRVSTLVLSGARSRTPLPLSRHFTHLKHLELDWSATSAMVQLILTSCPLLEHISAGELDARDILGEDLIECQGTDETHGDHQHKVHPTNHHPQEWVCTGLCYF